MVDFVPILHTSVLPEVSIKLDTQQFEIRINRRTKSGGPKSFADGLVEATKTFTGTCHFVLERSGYEDIENNDDPHRFFYTIWPSNFYHVARKIHSKNPKKLRNTLFGPIPIPGNWFAFPDLRIPNENNMETTLSYTGGWIVHSERVRRWLSTRSNTTHLRHKYKIISACTNILPEYVTPWKDRKHDVILFEKYADLHREQQGARIYSLLKKHNIDVVRMSYLGKYGYTRNQMMEWANTTKFVIYFSFYDTGAIGLKEIQNFGIYTFAHQEDHVFNSATGTRVKELDSDDIDAAVEKIIQKMREVDASNPDTEKMRKINQLYNNCDRSLHQLCDHVASMPTFAD